MTDARTVRVAAIQPTLRLGAVEENLIRLEGLIRSAVREHAPAVVTVPEAATSPNVYAPAMRDVARPVDGAPLQLYRQLARELDVVVGGGFLARRGRDTYGTYVLAEPDGRVHLHDKDIPTMWEHNYYRGGHDPGRTTLAALDDTPVGVACGWEWARHATVHRLRHRVQLLLGGMCWPSYPLNWAAPAGWLMNHEHARQVQHARDLPRQMARLLGAPVAIPSHVGPVDFDTPLAPGLPWRTYMLGETQIVERDGTILARLCADDGEGHIAADVTLREPEPLDPVPDLYWIPPLSPVTRAAWTLTNAHGRVKYRAARALHRHPWQQWPGGDLPQEIAPAHHAELLHATTGTTAPRPGDSVPDSDTLPHVDPYARHGLLYRAYIAFLSTGLGRWIVINVASKVDPWLLRVSNGAIHSGVVLPSALLETRGARSGTPRSNAVLYFHDGDHPVIIASSLGRAKHPAWYHNLRAHSDVRLGGVPFRAEEVQDGEERDRLWGLADRVYPPYATYRRMTRDVGRTIPIIRLSN